jgi:DNA (cytosine-5)-methyltransferase 1
LFCCAGGAGTGYHRAGFEVLGVDLNPQPNYPFEFHQGDALAFLAKHWEEFDAVHASPPCQASSALTKGTNKSTGWGEGERHVDLIPATRAFLNATGLPYVIENVQGSDLRRDMTLCGEMFGLRVLRHRYFELSGFEFTPPKHIPHRGRVAGYRHGEWFEGPYFAVYGDGGGKGTVQQWQDAMGIHWTDVRKEIAEAIPPAYTEFIGRQLMTHLQGATSEAA